MPENYTDRLWAIAANVTLQRITGGCAVVGCFLFVSDVPFGSARVEPSRYRDRQMVSFCDTSSLDTWVL